MNVQVATFRPFNPILPTLMKRALVNVTILDSVASANYTIVAQSRDEVLQPSNAPSLTMWPYLLNSHQMRRLNSISIYAERGTTAEQTRLLYMNTSALELWREMGRLATVIGEAHRPPQSATLSFGMPFSE